MKYAQKDNAEETLLITPICEGHYYSKPDLCELASWCWINWIQLIVSISLSRTYKIKLQY